MRFRTTASCQTPCIKYPLPFTGEQKYFVCMYMLEFQLVDMALSWRCPVFIIWVLCLSKHSSFLFRLKENLQKHKKSNKNVTFSRSKLICCRVASKCTLYGAFLGVALKWGACVSTNTPLQQMLQSTATRNTVSANLMDYCRLWMK